MERIKRRTPTLIISELYEHHICKTLKINEETGFFDDVEFMESILKNSIPPHIVINEHYDESKQQRILDVQTGGAWLRKAMAICDLYLIENKSPFYLKNPVLNTRERSRLFWQYHFPVIIVESSTTSKFK